jgi:hypothetical protein
VRVNEELLEREVAAQVCFTGAMVGTTEQQLAYHLNIRGNINMKY